MRRQTLRILGFLAVIACIIAFNMPTVVASQDEFAYTVSDSQATVTGYTGAGSAIAIPSTLGGYTVTAVAPCAFSGNTAINSVVIPQGIATIGDSAFEGCSSLTALYFRSSAPVLGTNGLLGCANGIVAYYPAGAGGWTELWNGVSTQAYNPSVTFSVTYDGNGAATGSAPADATVYLAGDAVTVLDAGSLAKGSDLFTGWNAKPDGSGKKYAAGSTLAVMDNIILYAQWKRDLTPGTRSTATVNGVNWSYTPLGSEYCEVNGCSPVPANMSIPSVLQGRTVIGVGISSFDSAAGLQNATLPAGIEYIARMAFRNCPDLMCITLPNSVTRIGEYAFYLCENLIGVKFPSSIADLGDGAFSCCSRLSAAVFTGDAPAMGELTFDRCSREFQICRTDTAQGWTNPYNSLSVQTYHPGDSYTVTYDVNGGTGTTPSAVTNLQMGDVFVAADQGGMQNGYYSFAGWNTSPDGKGTAYDVDCRIAATGNTTLYAVWYMNYREANYQAQTVIDGATWNYTPIGEFFCSVNDCHPASGFIKIPDFLDGRMVIGVAQCAFGYNADLTGVSIPSNVTTVTKYAFFNCTALSTVVFQGNAPTDVGYWAMKYCANGLTVYYPTGTSGWSDTWNGFTAQSYDSSALYTITYDGNGAQAGDAPADMALYQAFTPVSVPDNVGSLTKAYYSFGGWNTQPDGSGMDYRAGEILVITGSIRLYARWYLGDCSICFDRQDGSAATSRPVDYGALLQAPANPTRDGYTFGGWYPTAACNTTAVAFPYTVNGHVTLYAKWTLNRYYVTFDSQGGSAVAVITAKHGDTITAPANPTRIGFTFGGWYPSPDCNTTTAFFPYTVTGDVTLYAKWTQDPTAQVTYTVQFDSQGGSDIPDISANDGARITAPADPSRTGYTFIGWYKDAACAARWNFGSDAVAGSMTLYAGWAAQPKNAYLRGITLSTGTLSRAFNSKATSYTVNLDEKARSVTITPVRAYDGATLTIDGRKVKTRTVSLTNGKSVTVTVKVTWNRKTTTYKLTIRRAKSTNTSLLSLISNARTAPMTPVFTAGTTRYALTLPSKTGSMTISAKPADSFSKVYINGKARTSLKVSVKKGQSKTITILVKAQAGNKQVYTVVVSRK